MKKSPTSWLRKRAGTESPEARETQVSKALSSTVKSSQITHMKTVHGAYKETGL